MGDSVKLQILKAVKTAIEGISAVTIASVQFYRANEGNDKSALPVVIISSGPEPTTEEMTRLRHHKLDVMVFFYGNVAEDSIVGVDEYLDPFYQEIFEAVNADETFGGIAQMIEPSIDVVPFEISEGQPYVGFILKFTVNFRTDPDDLEVSR